MNCNKCGAPSRKNDKKCRYCGMELDIEEKGEDFEKSPQNSSSKSNFLEEIIKPFQDNYKSEDENSIKPNVNYSKHNKDWIEITAFVLSFLTLLISFSSHSDEDIGKCILLLITSGIFIYVSVKNKTFKTSLIKISIGSLIFAFIVLLINSDENDKKINEAHTNIENKQLPKESVQESFQNSPPQEN
jgi:hypothetical protein